jgi:ubiquinone/menaquinone biosynthesis C-methylase UbiE
LNSFEEIFSNVDGGHILDVASGEGGFIKVLLRYLHSFSSIIGIDIDDKVTRKALSSFQKPEVYFVQMDAEQLGFRNAQFDMVNISASLHHLKNVTRVLAEMKRSLRSGGKFILAEMHRDGMTEAQFNGIRIHHWAAAVDTKLGIIHDRTFAREEVLNFIDELDLCNVLIHDFPNTDSNPMDEKTLHTIEGYLDRYIRRAQKAIGSEILIQQYEELRRSIHETGFQREPVLIVVAEKP